MEESSREMSAEKMTEAMSLEKKPETLNSELTLNRNHLDGLIKETSVVNSAASLETPLEVNLQVLEKNTDGASVAELEVNASATINFTQKDPLDLVPYIEKFVKVKLERNYLYVGFIHSIDPITYSVILSVPKEGGTYQSLLIPGTSILDVTEVPFDSSIVPPDRKAISEIPTEDTEVRKNKLLSWLKDNRLPVTEEEANIVFGGIKLLPPYEDRDICTTNPLIALEIKKIIDRMPADYHPK